LLATLLALLLLPILTGVLIENRSGESLDLVRRQGFRVLLGALRDGRDLSGHLLIGRHREKLLY
jgi:hypothetical protein